MRLFDDQYHGFCLDPTALIGPAIGLAGSLIGGHSSSSAASQANAGNEAAIAEQRREFDLTQKNEAPFLTGGTNAENQLAWEMGLGPSGGAAGVNTGQGSYGTLMHPFSVSDFHTDPGYAFALQQGQDALQRTQAANGQLQSGAAAKAMDSYTQGIADQQYGAAYDRYNTNQNNMYNRLSGMVGTGQAAASGVAQAGTNSANQISGLQQQNGINNGNATMGQGAAWQTGLQNFGQAIGGMFNNSGGGSPNANASFMSNFN